MKINPQQPLHNVPLFWISIITPAVIAIALATPIVLVSGLPCFAPDCYEGFLSIFQLPLGVLSLSLVFGIMIGRFHGSAQRVASYEQNQTNNTLKNYFDHRKFFSEWYTTLHAKQVESLNYINLKSPPKLYGRLFQENTPSTVHTKLSASIARAAYRDIDANILIVLNRIAINEHVKSEDPRYALSPESAISEVGTAIKLLNEMLGGYGLSIKPLDEWPLNYEPNPVMRIMNEIAEILILSFEFSSTENPPTLHPSAELKKMMQEVQIQEYLSFATEYRDRKAP